MSNHDTIDALLAGAMGCIWRAAQDPDGLQLLDSCQRWGKNLRLRHPKVFGYQHQAYLEQYSQREDELVTKFGAKITTYQLRKGVI